MSNTTKPTPLHELDVNLVYEWVKTGRWTKKEFKDWLAAVNADVVRKSN